MGCVGGRQALYFSHIYSYDQSVAQHKAIFTALRLTETNVGGLKKIFMKIDKDASGTIEVFEMLMHFDIERTPFTKRVFSIFDDDGSGTIDFREFVMAMWNYCTLGKATLVLFAFDLYDRDNSGEIDKAEIRMMLKDVYGSAYNQNAHAKTILKTMSELSDGGTDVNEFRQFVKRHPALLYPAFEMQRHFQRKVLGEEFWSELGTKRIELSHGRYVAIAVFMQIHVDEAVYDRLIAQSGNSSATRKKQGTEVKEIYSKSGVKAKRLGNVEGGPNRKASLKDIENPAEMGWTVEEKHAKLTAKQKKLNQVREKQLKEEMSKGPSSSTDGDLGLLRSGADYRPPGDDVLVAGAYTGQSSWDADADVGEDADDSDDYDYRTSGGYFASKKVAPVGGARGTKSKPRKLSSFRDPNNVGLSKAARDELDVPDSVALASAGRGLSKQLSTSMMAPVTKQSKGTGTTLKVAQAAGKFKAAVKKKK